MKNVLLLLLVISVSNCATFQSSGNRKTSSTNEEPTKTKKRALIVMTLDGVGYDQLKKIDPNFLERAQIFPIKPPNPSFTFPAHATIATGVSPKFHGVRTNSFNPDPEQMNVEPVWTLAASKGLYVRTYQWPMSYGPWHGIHHHHNKTYLPYDKNIEFAEISKRILEELKTWDQTTNFLFMARTPGLDDIGHTYGPYDLKVIEEWKRLKKEIEEFQSQLDDIDKSRIEVLIIYLSDHGMAPVDICSPNCEFLRRQSDKGIHGPDPDQLHEMLGVIWIHPHQVMAVIPNDLSDMKSFILNYLGIEDH